LIEKRLATTRRVCLLLRRDADPILLVHRIESVLFKELSIPIVEYKTSTDFYNWIKENVHNNWTLAMEYCPNGLLPTVSIVDAGLVEFIKERVKKVVSSADLFQAVGAVWSKEAFNSHVEACKLVSAIKDKAFKFISDQLKLNKQCDEYMVQQLILKEFEINHLETEDNPIVAVNQHSGDPHYEPTKENFAQIKKGDWVLIDLWARIPGPENIFSDITWVAYAGTTVPENYKKTFLLVKEARDRVLAALRNAKENNTRIFGWELDEVARSYFRSFGQDQFFFHRTGHSISPGEKLHGLGVNLDSYETYDTREIIGGVGFSIEPGLYYNDHGVRLEINAYMDPLKGPIVVTPIQNEIVLI